MSRGREFQQSATREALEKEVEELREQIAGMHRIFELVNHELGTPLTAIKSYAEALVANYGDPAFTQGPIFLKVLCKETDRVIRITKRTLQVSRLTSRKESFPKTRFNVREVLDEIIESLLLLLKEREIKVELLVTRENAMLEADRDLVKQLFINLIHNAVKFSANETSISVQAKKSTGRIDFWVRDQGFGISQEETTKIFEPYFRSADSRISHVNGTGLGLNIVKTIVEQHGGSIEVESNVGKGTTFHFWLLQDSETQDAQQSGATTREMS